MAQQVWEQGSRLKAKSKKVKYYKMSKLLTILLLLTLPPVFRDRYSSEACWQEELPFS